MVIFGCCPFLDAHRAVYVRRILEGQRELAEYQRFTYFLCCFYKDSEHQFEEKAIRLILAAARAPKEINPSALTASYNLTHAAKKNNLALLKQHYSCWCVVQKVIEESGFKRRSGHFTVAFGAFSGKEKASVLHMKTTYYPISEKQKDEIVRNFCKLPTTY